MQSSKQIPRTNSKPHNDRLEKPISSGNTSPTYKRSSRCIISVAQNPHIVRKNSVGSSIPKQEAKQIQKEEPIQNTREIRKESICRKRLIDSRAIDQKVTNEVMVEKMQLIPLFISYNENNQIEESRMMEFKEEDISYVSQMSASKPVGLNQRWQTGQKVGRGATSEVYKAFDRNTGRIAAVKKIRTNEQICNSELDILTQLKHPNIVEYYGFYKGPIELQIYMEFIPTTLEFIYRNFGGSIPYENIRKYTRQLVSAVKYIHNMKIVHKDIKCSNILLDEKGTVKLSDFGSSKQFDQSTSAAAYLVDGALSFKGSILWTAPEVIKSSKFSRKSDIWSIGCTCLEMATGKSPWFQKGFQNQLMAIFFIGASDETPQVPQHLPLDLQDFIRKCLVRAPEQRKSADELLATDFIKEK